MPINEIQLLQLFSAALFCIGLFAAISRKNLILILVGIELMVNAALINFAVQDYVLGKNAGQIFSLFAMVLSAVSVGLTLAIIIKVYKYFKTLNPDRINNLKN